MNNSNSNNNILNTFTNFKYGPYDYYQAEDPVLKLPTLFFNCISFLEKYGIYIFFNFLFIFLFNFYSIFIFFFLKGLEEEGLLRVGTTNNKMMKRLRRLLAECMYLFLIFIFFLFFNYLFFLLSLFFIYLKSNECGGITYNGYSYGYFILFYFIFSLFYFYFYI